ncbi:MAG: nucleotidyltransferase domain-containing protein [Phycisphaerae bacterium]|nr:nucleotidyltransferase domain-containing protein [Phycisphaerae bacterium]
MVDVFRVADLLVSNAVKTHADEVDLIAYYGSYAKGTATNRSDLDIFYTPAEGKDPSVARTFLVEGILFDFWPIRWERLEAWATGRNGAWTRFTGVVHYAKVLHARSQEHTGRFDGLKKQILSLLEPEARVPMVRRALEEFKSALAHLGNLRLAIAGGDLADVRHAGWMVILAVGECLALANQTLLDQGNRSFLDQLLLLPVRPAELQQLIVSISTSADPTRVVAAAESLVLSTRSILRQFQVSLPSQQTVGARFREAYPEINAGLGKVLSACEREQPLAASLAAWFSQFDLSLMLSELRNGSGQPQFNLYSEFATYYREIGLPELMRFTGGDLTELAKQVRLFDERIRQWLIEHSVNLREFATLEDFERSL